MKKYLLPLLLLASGMSAVCSQNVGIGTATPLARLHVSDGSVVFTAVHPLPAVAGPTPVMGAGSRLMWYADKAAFRAGAVGPSDVFEDGTAYWDAPNVGLYSFAAGYNVKASHYGSVAIGHNARAERDFAIALGDGSLASGAYSFAAGYFARAAGDRSVSIGYANSARGNFASIAMGWANFAMRDASVSIGYKTRATGVKAISIGDSTVARAYGSISLGRFNDSVLSSSPTSWVATDPLLVVGNGISEATRHNALVVYKNANLDINGFTRLGKSTEFAPEIKMKKLTAVSSNVQNNWVNVPHGLTKSKIISVNIIMSVPEFVNVPPGYTYHPGYEYQYQVSDANIVVVNTNGNSANILLRNFTVLITYEE